jgi:glucosamine-phosphate N-acetyltransferase
MGKKKKAGPIKDAPANYEVRELRGVDLDRGFIETLGALSDTGGLTPKQARKLLKTMNDNSLYHVFVAVAVDGQVLGATTLLVEQKFIHGGGLVGHIEDVVVRKGQQGRGVGKSLVSRAVTVASELGCYKCILDCKDDLVGFYEKLGFRKQQVCMRIDLAHG